MELVQAKNIIKYNPFRGGDNDKLYNDWAANFIKNSKVYGLYRGHCLDAKRLKACTRVSLEPYFQLLRSVLFDEFGNERFKPWNMFNLDETNNQTRGNAKTVDFKNTKQSVKKEPTRMINTTFTFCISAAEVSLTTQMIHKGENVPPEYFFMPKI
jgi:hypothetical protein